MAAAIRLSQQHSCSFDHLVGAQQDRGRQLDANRLGGLEVDQQLELRRLLDGQIGGLGAACYPVNELGDARELRRDARPVGQQAARLHPFAEEQWLKDNPPRDLQELVERAGRRHAAAIGEEYVEEPLDEKGKLKRPQHQGGYQHITPEEWAEYDRAMAAWQAARRPPP